MVRLRYPRGMGNGTGTGGGRPGKRGAQVGLLGSSLLVFLCGYYAMQTEDWRRILAFTALAAVAGVVASGFARRAR